VQLSGIVCELLQLLEIQDGGSRHLGFFQDLVIKLFGDPSEIKVYMKHYRYTKFHDSVRSFTIPSII